MFYITKISNSNVIDFAAEELKKYLRMLMPEGGDADILYEKTDADCFKLGLMTDFGLDVSDAENTELDDIIYIDCDEKGGIIAGANPRAVLIAVYEYLRQNGCRWLFPGIEGECIPVNDIKPVKYRHKPSLRFRGWMSEGALYQYSLLDAIDFMPKLGMNLFMTQFFNSTKYCQRYYEHERNTENRKSEPVSYNQVLQWKRNSETEMAKRGIQVHDGGHGFNCDPFGITLEGRPADGDYNAVITPEQRQYLSHLWGKRQVTNNSPLDTHFCMSNPEARNIVTDFVKDYALKHPSVDYVHFWLADGIHNQCECEECQKKRPSDWYVILLNELDEKLTKAGSKTRIVYCAYVDTTWAPLEETFKNQDRFVMIFAPFFRSYGESVALDREKTELKPFVRNHNSYPDTLGASLDYHEEWCKTWHGDSFAVEYHFWRHQCADITGLMQSKLIYDDIKAYIHNKLGGVVACGTQRCFFPNGLSFYTFARAMFDASLTYEDIKKDYYGSLYGEEGGLIEEYLKKVYDVLPYEYFARDNAQNRENVYFDPKRAELLSKMRSITKEGRTLIGKCRKNDYRVRTVALNILEYHADFCDLLSDWMLAKARGEAEKTEELFERFRVEIGKKEYEFERYFDMHLYFGEYTNIQKLASPGKNEAVRL